MSPYLILLLYVYAKAADLNVGTTLFTKADSCKECWSSESLALLTSRMILEDLLPSTSILVIDCNEFVSDLVEYFRMILEVVRKETHGKTKHITLLALTDLLGGYLHHAVLPIAKFAYYSGLIDYESMETLLGLFEELKWFLRTNGQGWAKPLPQSLENFEIQRIPLQPNIEKEKCENLIFVEGESPGEEESHCNAIVPLPFFDSITAPSAVALPTKSCPLHNVEANTSSYLIMKFFITSYKCLLYRNVKSENLVKFQTEFCGFVEDQIMPRLEDEKFYSAFGGILRVRNTLKRLGISQKNSPQKLIEDFHRNDENIEGQELAQATAAAAGTPQQMSRSSMILTAVLITLFVWFLLGTMFICYKMRQTRQKASDSNDGEDGGKTTTCTSLASSKYFYPEKPKYKDKKGTSTPDTEQSDFDSGKKSKTSLEDDNVQPSNSVDVYKLKWSLNQKHKGRRHEITIKTCRCHDDDVEEETVAAASAANVESSRSHTEGRLASITEMSEQTTTPRAYKGSTGETTSTGGSTGTRRGKVQKQIYMDTETETEETSEPA